MKTKQMFFNQDEREIVIKLLEGVNEGMSDGSVDEVLINVPFLASNMKVIEKMKSSSKQIYLAKEEKEELVHELNNSIENYFDDLGNMSEDTILELAAHIQLIRKMEA